MKLDLSVADQLTMAAWVMSLNQANSPASSVSAPEEMSKFEPLLGCWSGKRRDVDSFGIEQNFHVDREIYPVLNGWGVIDRQVIHTQGAEIKINLTSLISYSRDSNIWKRIDSNSEMDTVVMRECYWQENEFHCLYPRANLGTVLNSRVVLTIDSKDRFRSVMDFTLDCGKSWSEDVSKTLFERKK